jgi:hypothetical protein
MSFDEASSISHMSMANPELSTNQQNLAVQLGEGSRGPIYHFKIPVKKEVICAKPQDDLQFYVQDRADVSRLDEAAICEQLEAISARLCGTG